MPRSSGRNRRSSSTSSRSASPYNKHQRERISSPGRGQKGHPRSTLDRHQVRRHSPDGRRRPAERPRSLPHRRSHSRSRSPWRRGPPNRPHPPPRHSPPRRKSPTPPRRGQHPHSPQRGQRSPHALFKPNMNHKRSSPVRGEPQQRMSRRESFRSRSRSPHRRTEQKPIPDRGWQDERRPAEVKTAWGDERRREPDRERRTSESHNQVQEKGQDRGRPRENKAWEPERARHGDRNVGNWSPGSRERRHSPGMERRRRSPSVDRRRSSPGMDRQRRNSPGLARVEPVRRDSWGGMDEERAWGGQDRGLETQRIQSPEAPQEHRTVARQRELGMTGTGISDRFASTTEQPRSFHPTENITVGIERNVAGNEPAVIHKEVIPKHVVIVRRTEEGAQPFYRREEFKGPKEEYIERRVVRVIRPDGNQVLERYEQQFQRENFKVRRDRFQSAELTDGNAEVVLNERWGDDGGRKRTSREQRAEKAESRRGDSRTFTVDRPQEVVRVCGPFVTHGDRDERIITEKSYSSSSRTEKWPENESRSRRSGKDDFERQPHDLRHNLQRRRSTRDEQAGFDARQKILERRKEDGRRRSDSETFDNRKDLPDFSKRPEKYDFEEWKEKPEMVPKGTTYYEVKYPHKKNLSYHSQTRPGRSVTVQSASQSLQSNQHDNRGDVDYWVRGRGRGGFRGRFRGRGRGFHPYRGRPGYNRNFTDRRDSQYIGEWKHDKFKENDDDQDNKPTSTTK